MTRQATCSELVELADTVIQRRAGLNLEQDKGSEAYSELYIYHFDGKFYCSLTHNTDPHYYCGTFYEPPETVWQEEHEESEGMVSINAVDRWCKDNHFDLSKSSKV